MKQLESTTEGRVSPTVGARLAQVAVRGSVALNVRRRRNERGMVSAEWAVGIIAAVAIAGVLLSVVTNGKVEDLILDYILEVIRSFSGGIDR